MFKTIRILSYFLLTIIVLILSFAPVGYAFYFILHQDNLLAFLLSPVLFFTAYILTVLIFAFLHSQLVLRFTLGIGIKPGKYPHNTSEGRLVGVKLTADSIFKSMIKIFTFFPFIWGMLLFPYGMRLYGLKTGKNVHVATNTYIESAGIVQIGKGSFIGYGATIVAHVHENREIIISPVKIGKKVTLGGFSALAPGVEVGDNSIIGAFSVVSKGMKIPPNQIWIGIPAKFYKNRGEKTNTRLNIEEKE